MHIALLVSALQPHQKESLAITTINLAQQLAKEKQEVTIVSRNKWNLPAFEKKEGVAFLRIKNINKLAVYNKLLAFPLAIRKLTKSNKIEVLHSFSSAPLLVLRSLLAQKFFARKAVVIHTLKSYSIRKDVTAKSGSKLLSMLGNISYHLLNYADIITVPTAIFADRLCSKKIEAEKIRIIGSHINLSRFYPQQKEKLKKKYNYGQKNILFYYGAMWEIKGTEYLIQSIPKIIQKNPETLFVFAPRNLVQAKEKYFHLIKKLGIESYVQFIEKEVVIEDYVNLADLVVLPYPHLEGTEGNPSCLLEAMACKTAVVTTDLPELKEIAEGCVFFAKPGDVESLAETINHALNNPDLEMVERAYQKAQEFSVEKITQKFLNLYEEAIKKKKANSS
ncbi:MAG TPA: glycosyltransferase family 4 protein [Candidatus Nanoarchaeia archaeon]|nr:glycosyltransferase family 4 protein [Candidatus Nanoarchaeia archaeon]